MNSLNLTNSTKTTVSRIREVYAAGLLSLVPFVLTFIVVEWVAQKILGVFGPNAALGHLLTSEGHLLVGSAHNVLAYLIGLTVTLGFIGILGLLVRRETRGVFGMWLEERVLAMPLIGAVYRPAARVVSILAKDEDADLRRMSVVTCYPYGPEGSAAIGLLTSRRIYKVSGRPNNMIFLPHAPVPMTGSLVLLPIDTIIPMPDMSVDELLQLSVSLGLVARSETPRAV